MVKGEFIGALDCGTTSVRFIVFDEVANIIAEHQLEFPQYYPRPSWHDHNPQEIVDVSEQCIERAVAKLGEKGFPPSSIKAIGITNQRETTVAWSRKTGKHLCNAIVWDDSRNKGEVSHYERILKETGFELDGKVVNGDEGVEAVAKLQV